MGTPGNRDAAWLARTSHAEHLMPPGQLEQRGGLHTYAELALFSPSARRSVLLFEVSTDRILRPPAGEDDCIDPWPSEQWNGENVTRPVIETSHSTSRFEFFILP